MKQTQKLTSIVTALMAISHNRVDHPKGATFEVDEKDIVFLNLAGCVRDPTDDELKAYEARQTLATVTATEPEQPDVPQVPIHTEPEAVEPVEVVEFEADEPKLEGWENKDSNEPVNVYDGWLKKDLNAELDKRGIEHDASARNDELEALLMADDAHKAQAQADA